jgi:hypothetical protein
VLPAAAASDVVSIAARFDTLEPAQLDRLLAILAGAAPHGPAA